MPATATSKRSVTSRSKSASSKKAAASANGSGANGDSGTRRSAEATLELAKQIKEAREAGKSWANVKAELGVDPAQGQYLIKVASVKPKDRIKFDSDDELRKQAAALRKDGLSKAEIAARASVSVPRIKRILDEKPGTRKAAAPKVSKAKAEAKADGGDTEGKTRKRRKRAEVAQDPSNA